MQLGTLLSALALVAGQSCNKYMCAPSSVALSSDTCAYGVGTAFYLQICTDALFSFCEPITAPGNATCEVPPPAPLYLNSAPGEPCVLDMDCVLEGICLGGVCANPSGKCTAQLSCDPGTYCDVTEAEGPWDCVPQVPATGNCSNDYMCPNAYGCNNKTCVRYLSLGPSMPVETCDTGFNYLCQFLLCYTDESIGGLCAGNVTSAVPVPAYCDSHTPCKSAQFNGHTFAGVCSCSYGTMGRSYCSLFPGDYPQSQLLAYMTAWVNSASISRCNTARRNSPTCISYYLPANQSLAFLYYYYFAGSFPLIQDMDQCARSIYVQSYWTTLDQYEGTLPNHTEPSAASRVAVASVLVAAVFA